MLAPVTKPTFEACGVLTLTTDIGHKGPFVATMKGVMLSRFPDAKIVDLTHETDVHFPGEAGFWLTRAYRFFPAGTTHVAVVDPGVGTQRDIITTIFDGHAFLAPDNGLLAPLAERDGAATHVVDLQQPERLGLGSISSTFHGRDIFAPIGAAIAAGQLHPADLGPTADSVVPSWIEDPKVGRDRVTGVVVAADNFGNLITNIGREYLDRFQKPVVKAAGRSFTLLRTYGDTTPGEFLALINSFETLELARAEQSAADALGLSRGAPVVVCEE